MRRRGGRARSARAGSRRGVPRRGATPTRAPSARAGRASRARPRRAILRAADVPLRTQGLSLSRECRRCGLTALDERDDPRRRLLDRELRDLDHGAAEPTVELLGLLELVVDLDQLVVAPVVPPEPLRAVGSDLREA